MDGWLEDAGREVDDHDDDVDVDVVDGGHHWWWLPPVMASIPFKAVNWKGTATKDDDFNDGLFVLNACTLLSSLSPLFLSRSVGQDNWFFWWGVCENHVCFHWTVRP